MVKRITREVDVVVIGAGTAGLNARREAERHGKSVVMVERGIYGTTCARVGCMPSKLLIAAADAAHHAREAGTFGVQVEPPRIDGPAVMKRVRDERDRFTGFVVRAIEGFDDAQKLRGNASFISESSVEVELETPTDEATHVVLNATAVVIAAGSTPFVPPPLRGVGDRVIDNEGLFNWTTLPHRVAVVGTGVIGLELGQALARLGVAVTFLANNTRIGPTTDPEVSAYISKSMQRKLDFSLNANILSATQSADGIEMTWESLGDEPATHTASFDYILCAAGRVPNLTDLKLEGLNLDTTERGIPRFDGHTMCCMRDGEFVPIFLAGDITNERTLLHEASDEGHIAGHNAAIWPEVRSHARRTPIAVVFSSPQIGMVGETYAALEASGDRFFAGTVLFDDQGRARVMAENEGIVRIYGRCKDGMIAGAEMYGPNVEHHAHLLAWAIQRRTTVHEALALPYYHPVTEEGIRTAIRDLAKNMRLTGSADPLDNGPGG